MASHSFLCFPQVLYASFSDYFNAPLEFLVTQNVGLLSTRGDIYGAIAGNEGIGLDFLRFTIFGDFQGSTDSVGFVIDSCDLKVQEFSTVNGSTTLVPVADCECKKCPHTNGVFFNCGAAAPEAVVLEKNCSNNPFILQPIP